MRIKQLYCNFGYHFAQAIAAKYNLENRTHDVKFNQPLFMFGCYNYKQASLALLHARQGQLVVICWAGSDSMMIRRTQQQFRDNSVSFSFVDSFRSYANIKHIAISHWIAEDLQAVGLEYKLLPITPHDFSSIVPEPHGESVYMYQPANPNYNGGIYEAVKERLPTFNFIETKFGDHERDQLMELYKKSFIGLRFTEHDGLSNTVCELGHMGRRVISNGDTPNCIKYDKNNIDHIVDTIKSEYNITRSGIMHHVVCGAVEQYLNIGDDFLNTEYYEQV